MNREKVGIVLRMVAAITTIVGFIFTLKADWVLSSLCWNVTSGFLWVNEGVKT